MRMITLAFGLLATPLAAHELWLAPEAYQISGETKLAAHLVNGQDFAGTRLPYLPRNISRFMVFADGKTAPVESRLGSIPAVEQPPLAEGLNIVAYISNYATVNYKEWEKFQSFVDHKDLGDVLSVHRARGLPEENFDEAYLRFSKTLIGVGHSGGADSRLGMETELVALANPYTEAGDGQMRVQLFYQRDVRADAQIEVFEKDTDGTVAVSYYRTDDAGIAEFPVEAGHEYMVDAVVLREPSARLAADTGAVWETLWANLTFAVVE